MLEPKWLIVSAAQSLRNRGLRLRGWRESV